MAIPSAPPVSIRKVVFVTLAPAVFALITPAIINPTKVVAIIESAFPPRLGANAPRNGISPPAVKLSAEATAAWIGLALVAS
jgi:hypothetical protein